MLHPKPHERKIVNGLRGNAPIEERLVIKVPTCCCDGDGVFLDGDAPEPDGVKFLIQSRTWRSFFEASLPI